MSKFLKDLALFLIPIMTFSIVVEVLCRKIPNDYNYKKNYLDSNSNKIQVLVLGSSHSYYGVNPTYMHLRAFNAAYISQSLDYDWELVKMYRHNLHQLKYIVLPVDYFSLYANLADGSEAWRKKDYIIYEHITLNDDFVDNTELLSNKLLNNLLKIRSVYLSHTPLVLCSNSGWGADYRSALSKDLLFTGKLAAVRHTATLPGDYQNNINIIKNIIQFASHNGVTVILYTSPAYKTYVENLSKNQLNITLNVLNLLSKSSKIKYFNFMNDKSFIMNDFYDADHLNDVGAKKFTSKIDSIIISAAAHSKGSI